MSQPTMGKLDPLPEKEFQALKEKLIRFMHSDIYPNEKRFLEECHAIGLESNEWTHAPILMDLKRKAKSMGLWNLFLPVDSAAVAGTSLGGGLTNRQYAEVCEIMGTSAPMEFAAQATNCTSPDTGNMETLARYGNEKQKAKWLIPLLEGRIRSAYAMTEPGRENGLGSSDATNMSIQVDRDEETKEYVINGRKWWITGAGSLHCKIMIVMGKTNKNAAKHAQTSQILVPTDTPGITFLRPMLAFGENDAPKGHMEIIFENVRVPFENVLLGEGRGFEISQGRLGPGRIHHCMRLVGQAERCLSAACDQVSNRTVFGKKLSKNDIVRQDIAKCRANIECCRLLVYKAADRMDQLGNKDSKTRQMLSLVKAYVPQTVGNVIDTCMQMCGARGFSQDSPIFSAFCGARWLRMADGPDEVHYRTAGRLELQQQESNRMSGLGNYEVDETNIFRRSTDVISEKTIKILEEYSKL
jgi:alkylation response protein AidB-like acyl-CoA dehydrogenase